MTRVHVIDAELRPTNGRFPAGAFRLMECDVIGWVNGRVVAMAIHGQTAVPAVSRRASATTITRVERWQVFEDHLVGSWIAWVQRPRDDERDRRERWEQQIDLLMIAIILFVGAVMAAIVLVVLPQCTGGKIG